MMFNLNISKMKKFVFLLMSFALLFVSGICIAQQPDTALTINNVANQAQNVVTDITGQDLTFKILYLSTLAGFLFHIVIYTIDGVKNSKTSPYKFAWSYFIKDNALSKISGICTWIIASPYLVWMLAKLPGGIISYIVIGVIGAVIGYLLDFVYSKIKRAQPKKA